MGAPHSQSNSHTLLRQCASSAASCGSPALPKEQLYTAYAVYELKSLLCLWEPCTPKATALLVQVQMCGCTTLDVLDAQHNTVHNIGWPDHGVLCGEVCSVVLCCAWSVLTSDGGKYTLVSAMHTPERSTSTHCQSVALTQNECCTSRVNKHHMCASFATWERMCAYGRCATHVLHY